jgi:hypothetical protein
MSLTSIRNPLNEAEALVAYCSSNANLALEHWPIGAGSSGGYVDNSANGIIISPADFASARFNNTVAIFGIIGYTDSKGVNRKAVATVSPVLNPVATRADSIDPGDYQSLAASGNEKSKVYVFYLKEGDGTKNKPQIHSASLSPSQVTIKSILDQCYPSTGSRLASCYDLKADTPLVFFQYGASGQTNLQWVALASKNPLNIRNSTGMADGTPLAATNVPHDADSNVFIYLYCRNSQNSLTSFVYDTNKQTWAGPNVLQDAPPVDPSSGLSVVADPTNGRNLLYYMPSGDSSFLPYIHIY